MPIIFIVSGFMLKSLIHMDLSFVLGDKHASVCILAHWQPVRPETFVDDAIFVAEVCFLYVTEWYLVIHSVSQSLFIGELSPLMIRGINDQSLLVTVIWMLVILVCVCVCVCVCVLLGLC